MVEAGAGVDAGAGDAGAGEAGAGEAGAGDAGAGDAGAGEAGGGLLIVQAVTKTPRARKAERFMGTPHGEAISRSDRFVAKRNRLRLR